MNDLQQLPRQAVHGMALGLLFLSFFGALWGVMSAGYMAGAFQTATFLLVGLVTLGFWGVVMRMLRYARTLPDWVSPGMVRRAGRTWNRFGIIFGIESGLIAIASIVLARVKAVEYIAPVVALIVGLHFLPLARLFEVRAYTITGLLLCAIALIALVALMLGLPSAGWSGNNWSLFVGVGATLVLWMTALFLVRMVQQLLKWSW